MSAELGRNHERQFAVAGTRASVNDWVKSYSYGPFSHVQAAIIGFVIGTVAFLIADAAVNPTPGQLNELPTFLLFACSGSVLALGCAIASNYLLGRRIRDEVELERSIFAAGKLPPPLPVPDDELAIDLRPKSRSGEPVRRRPLPAKRELESL